MTDINEKWAASLRTGRQNPAEMPTGGSADDVLTKNSSAPYDVKWKAASGGGGGSSSGVSGAVQTSDGAGGFNNIGSNYVVLPGALEAAGGFVVNEAGQGKSFYSSHGLASIGEGAFTYVNFDYAALTHTFKTGAAGDVDALVLAADGSANFPVGASVDGDDVITDGTLAAALAGLEITPPAVQSPTVIATAGLVTPIVVGSGPQGVAITPDGTTMYVVNNGDSTVTPVDLATNVAGTPIAVGAGPQKIAISPDGTKAYVTNYSDNNVTPIAIPSNAAGAPIDTGSTSAPFGVAFTPDGSKAYITCVDVTFSSIRSIDAVTDALGPFIHLLDGDFPEGLAITPDGAKAFVTVGGGFVYPITLAGAVVGSPITVGSGPIGIGVTNDGVTAYCCNAGATTVTPITVATDIAGSPIVVGNAPQAIAFTPNGKTAYIANNGAGTVVPLDLATKAAGAPITVGSGPYDVAIAPNGAAVYIPNGNAGTVSVIVRAALGKV